MSKSADRVGSHYHHGALLEAILTALERLGKTPDSVTVEDLAAVDEFHIGGRAATERFLGLLSPEPEDHILDVGCGLGGASRFAAQRYGCRVTGIDLTREFVETGNALAAWVGLDRRVKLDRGNATATPYPAETFDRAFMLHVGMNIADKGRLMSELHRVLRPGGTLGIYDVMRVGEGELTFPVPWATSAELSAVASPGEYREHLEAAGFRVESESARREFALEFFFEVEARAEAAEGPSPLGTHILMGDTAPLKYRNVVENITENRIAPVEIIARRAP